LRVFAIGDIHGCAGTFKALAIRKLKLETGDKIYLLGDLIDRGPDTKGVFDFIFSLRESGIHVTILRGNHEQMLLDSISDDEAHQFWLKIGGREVLESFKTTHARNIPEKYLNEIQLSQKIIFHNNFILVHAGLDFSEDDPLKNEDAFMRIRKMQVNKKWLGGRKIIHGHTPQVLSEILNQDGTVFNLDSGCVFPGRPGQGYLVALELENLQFHYAPYGG
jgi:serine/threonine protein phosphatase 1